MYNFLNNITGGIFSNGGSNNPEQPKKIARRRSNLPKRFKKNEFINILLLGGTGVGKSTFINSFANYLMHGEYTNAQKSKLLRLIQMQISIGTKLYTIGEDENEDETTGASSTQNVKSYTFPLKEFGIKLRLIDTPGLADTRGLDQDEANCEYILEHIGSMENLHAICILMKSGIDRISVEFEYCIRQILTRLEKSATQNIIFVITNARGRNYKGAETLNCLKKFVSDIKKSSPNIDIPVDQLKNVFCVDNEGFKYLIALQHNIPLPVGDPQTFIKSWDVSAVNCWKMISYIIGDEECEPLPPHKVQNSVSINEARRVVGLLQQPLAEITQLLSTNVDFLKKHEERLNDENQSLEDIKKNMYIPHVNLKAKELTQPVTVCAAEKCAKIHKIEDREIWTYPQKCHNPCYLTNVQKEIIGDSNLIGCAAMRGSECMLCGCSYKEHMHIYYEAEFSQEKLEDVNAVGSISTKEEALAAAQSKIEEIKARTSEFEEEHGVIVNTTAQFIHFLQNNAIGPFDDSFKAYLKHLIKRENNRGRNTNPKTISCLERLLKRHEEEKTAYDKAVADIKDQNNCAFPTSPVTPETIFQSITRLFNLKHYGAQLRDVYEKQKKCLQHEQKNRPTDYTHHKSISTTKVAERQESSCLIFVNY